MISHLSGTLSSLGTGSAVISVGGVGLEVLLTATHVLELRLGSKIELTTALIVREDALTLYGFRDGFEREVFHLLTSVSGVGPKSAMGVLSQLTPEALSTAIETEDEAAFKRVSGVGPKTARLIIVQLKGKLSVSAASTGSSSVGSGSGSGLRADVVEALIGLGTPQKQAQAAVVSAETKLSDDADVQSLLRAALRELGGIR